ncbi:CPBP family intramembrane glutamic endopeptidase [Sphingobacterium gobiense]|uniref:CPBP family intramembrane metalloprotease domain-containing protein n=1 Tax=Sphingobacterium gobiense TaxID=1382456 RepID=A0A2S9JLA6_9SPHI|nr:CPBP family intramembrane glutamic endopeptidase [Sphingobacterium gobiense]PRD53769.1 CPBP family intramembrane metalloprotease domain-containing protein [Sphingobacterium gobiense]
MNTSEVQERSPWGDLLFLIMVLFICVFAVSLIFGGLGYILFGNIDFFSEVSGANPAQLYYAYLVLGISSAATFILPAYIFQRRKKEEELFPSQNLNDWKTYVLSILFLFAFSPCMSLISEWNANMRLPESWRNIEEWMRIKEDQMALLTESIVMTTAWDRLLLNIVVMAILPGIGEELFFRGALQQIGTRIFKNEYVAVWVVALVFSAIHIQFYGFFPRLILGVFFGYLVVWTRNIWTAIIAHFVNNSMVVILAFYYATQGKSYAELMESDSYPIIVYLGSFVFSIIIAFIFYQYITRLRLYGKRLD